MTRILLIDEDPATADLTRSALAESFPAAELVAALTGKDGFRYLVHGAFDLCILEYALPDMTGVQLCTLMQQTGCSVPMVFLTAMDRAIDRERALAAGAKAFISKAEDLHLLEPTLRSLLMRAVADTPVPEFARAA